MSWYPRIELEPHTQKYIKLLESTYNVLNPDKKWVPYILQPHQVEWHAHDVAITHTNAKSRLVVKSRNTSFTTSTFISCLSAVPFYPNTVVPFVRQNIERAIDLIKDCKEIIKNINVVKDGDQYLPFDKDEVYMKNNKSILFPNNVEFRAFPANADAANTIRGLRVSGNAGILDEVNYVRNFEDIYIALRDAASGSKDGMKAFQMNIGTTLRGRATPFNIWREKIVKQNAINYFEWPVFNPQEFDVSRSIFSQELKPIVPWHSLEDLEQKRLEDKNRFLEEYMAQLVDSEEQFYPYDLILKTVDETLKPIFTAQGKFWIGIDVASINDFFAISVFEEIDNVFYQRYLRYVRQVELEDMEEEVYKIINIYKPIKVRIDAQGMGIEIAQRLKRRYGSIIDPIASNKVKGIEKHQTISINEYLHVNQKMMMNDGRIKLLSDDMQIQHYAVWDYNYKADSTAEWGHGDICMANGYALLPFMFKFRKNKGPLKTNLGNKSAVRTKDIELMEKIQDEVEW